MRVRALRAGLSGEACNFNSHPGVRVRAQAIHVLSRRQDLRTNFVLRQAFWNGALATGQLDAALAQSSRREFVANMINSDYVLCARGAGNFSYRLYETLSCGRIPILVDTDCVLPYDDVIDWRQYCVWVDEQEIEAIGEQVLSFHSALTAKDFRGLQIRCRRLWEEWLSPQGFFAHLHCYLG